MSRPKKYSTPEVKAVAHTYSVLKRQRELQDKIITLLGSKCSVCSNPDPKVLVVSGGVPANWAGRLRDVQNHPTMFSLTCANCNLASLNTAALKRLDELHGVLYKEELRRSQEQAELDVLREEREAEKQRAAREYAQAQKESIDALKEQRAQAIEAQFQKEKEESDKLMEAEKRKHMK